MLPNIFYLLKRATNKGSYSLSLQGDRVVQQNLVHLLALSYPLLLGDQVVPEFQLVPKIQPETSQSQKLLITCLWILVHFV